MPNPSLNNNDDDFYIAKAAQGISEGESPEDLETDLMELPNFSPERAHKIRMGAEKMVGDTRPSDASKTDFGLFGGTEYKGLYDNVANIDNRLGELQKVLSTEDSGVPSGDAEFRAAYPELIKEKLQLEKDKQELLNQQGKVIKEVAARGREAGTLWFGDDGPDSEGYAHSDEKQFIDATLNWLNQHNPALGAKEVDGQITALDENGERYVVREDFFTSLKAQRWELTGAAIGTASSLALAGAGAKKGAALGANLGARIHPRLAAPLAVLGYGVGGAGAFIGGNTGASILGGAGAALDFEETVDMLEQVNENRELRLREADGILKKWGFDDDVPYVAQKAADAAVADAALGVTLGTAVKGSKSLLQRYTGLFKDAIGPRTTEEGVDIVLDTVGFTREQAIARKNAYRKTLVDNPTTDVGNRPIWDLDIVPDRFKKAKVTAVEFDKLSENDQIIVSILATKGSSDSLRPVIGNLMKRRKLDNLRVLIDDAAQRADGLKKMVAPNTPYLPTHYAHNLLGLRKAVIRGRESFRFALDTETPNYKSNTPILNTDVQRAVKEADTAPANLGATQDFLRVLKTKFGAEAVGEQLYNPNAVSGHQFMKTYDRFIIDSYGPKGNYYGKRELRALESTVEKLVENKYGTVALKDFRDLKKNFENYNTLTNQELFKAIEKSDLAPETIENLILESYRSRQTTDSLYGARRTVLAMADALLERHKVDGKIADDDPIKTTKLLPTENPADVDRLVDAIDSGKGFDAVEAIEVGSLGALKRAYTVKTGGLDPTSGPGVAQEIVDYAKLREDVQGLNFQSEAAKEQVDYINIMGAVYESDPDILKLIKEATPSVDPSSGTSIATTVEGKFKIAFVSQAYETILSYVGGNRFSRAKLLIDTITPFLHGNLPKAKDGFEMMQQATQKGANK